MPLNVLPNLSAHLVNRHLALHSVVPIHDHLRTLQLAVSGVVCKGLVEFALQVHFVSDLVLQELEALVQLFVAHDVLKLRNSLLQILCFLVYVG